MLKKTPISINSRFSVSREEERKRETGGRRQIKI